MVVDENLIRAVERLIDGGVGHHYYGTIHRYLHAQTDEDRKKQEDQLRQWVLWRTKELMPETYRAAVDAFIEQANSRPVPCEACRKGKVHGGKCSGGMKDGKREPCWCLREPCEGCDGRCCKCYATLQNQSN